MRNMKRSIVLLLFTGLLLLISLAGFANDIDVYGHGPVPAGFSYDGVGEVLTAIDEAPF